MADAMRAFPFAIGPKPPPLIGKTSASGPCNWSKYGLHPGTLTVAEFNATYNALGRKGGAYIEHMQVSQPRYSLLRVRAAVEVDHYFGELGAQGFTCHLVRGLHGWLVQECNEVWVS